MVVPLGLVAAVFVRVVMVVMLVRTLNIAGGGVTHSSKLAAHGSAFVHPTMPRVGLLWRTEWDRQPRCLSDRVLRPRCPRALETSSATPGRG